MRLSCVVCLVLAGVVRASSADAATATSLSSFEGREEPAVVYSPLSNAFTPDSYPNMTDQGSGIVRFELRYRPGQWWDGDRTTTSRDRQRAEVKGLGPHQKPNESFEYSTTWRTNPTFTGSGRFCHFFQLKATDGDSGAPLVVASIGSGQSSATARYWPGTSSNFIVARSYNWVPDTWQNLRLRITTSVAGANTGELRASVNGDALEGVTGVPMYRPDSTDYRPKWGLYRGVEDGLTMIGDDYVEHKDAAATKVSTDPPPPGLRFEAELIPLQAFGATTAVQNDAKNSGGKWMALLADGAGDSVEYTLQNVPAGTYDLTMKYKSHPNRGVITIHLDGAPIGPQALDQYSNPQAYPEIFLGTVRLAVAGDHVIRQTVLGKNPLAGAFTASADVFILLPDRVPPRLTVPDDIEVEATGPGGATVSFSATASDDKDGEVPVTLSPPSGSLFALGESAVVATAFDFAGNKGTESFTITVVDTTPPVLTLPPNVTLSACDRPNIGQATAVDLASTPVVTNDAPALFGLGVTYVTWRAVDPSGNVATGVQTVTIELGDDPKCCPVGANVIVGTSAPNVLVGTAGPDCILGLGGHDVIAALGGDDLLSGGAGNDTIVAGLGDDLVMGGPGDDIIAAGPGSDDVDGGPGTDVCAVPGDGTDSVAACP